MTIEQYVATRDAGLKSMMSGDLRSAARALAEARCLAEHCLDADPDIVDKADVNLAMIRVQTHEDELAEKGLREVILRSRNDDVIRLAAHCLAKVLSHGSAHDKAQRFAQLSLDKARSLGDSLKIHSALQLMGAVMANRSYLDEAVAYYREALALIEAHPLERPADQAFYWSAAMDWLGYVMLLIGRVEEGRRHLERAHERALEFGITDLIAETASDLSFACLLQGDLEPAARHGEEALGLAEREGYEIHRRNCYYLLGEVASRRGDEACAETYYRKLGDLYPRVPFLGQFLREFDISSMINLKEFA